MYYIVQYFLKQMIVTITLSFLDGPEVIRMDFYCYRTAKLYPEGILSVVLGTPPLNVPNLLGFVPKSGGLPKLLR